ncbi:MAG: Uma2 family endonuclease [Candidatus Methylumidiphilus sp.]
MHNATLQFIDQLHLPFPWETNARGQIIMTPVNYGHSSHVGDLIQLFARIAPSWKTGSELGIATSDGVKAPDVTLASLAYHARHLHDLGYVSEAPEICIEVMSPSNSWQEMQDKMPLYFEVGALEVWIVDVDGTITFFAPGNQLLPQSMLIPEAPQSI